MKHYEFILSGFGGQGILSMGRLLAYAGMSEGYNVSWLPSYGPEMRGGTANCNVIISELPVGSPIINEANGIIAMNTPSLEKFEKMVIKGGFSVYDGSLVKSDEGRTDIKYYNLPATELAGKAGNPTYAGIVLIGKLIALTGVVSEAAFEEALRSVLPEKKHHMIPEEMEMLRKGME